MKDNKRTSRGTRASVIDPVLRPVFGNCCSSGGHDLKERLSATAGLALLLVMSAPTMSKAFEKRIGELDVDLRAKANLQGAFFSDSIDSGVAGNVDWAVRLRLEYLLRSGWLVGTSVEVDHDVDIASDATIDSGAVELDEAYAFIASHWGRFEAGKKSGPADTMSLHAPITGTGQVAGDFSRYAGSDAQFSPYDSRDALKLVYLSPPFAGLRIGTSFAPSLESNADAVDPTARTIQSNLLELAAQYQTVQGPVSLGLSGAFVTGSADAETQRADIQSWSIGTELRYEDWRVGGAFVSRGDSNSLTPIGETEINAGIGWSRGRWDLAASTAFIERDDLSRRLIGAGTSIDLNRYLTLRFDGVMFNETYEDPLLEDNDGFVVLSDLRIVF